jgi:hypothetical protein
MEIKERRVTAIQRESFGEIQWLEETTMQLLSIWKAEDSDCWPEREEYSSSGPLLSCSPVVVAKFAQSAIIEDEVFAFRWLEYSPASCLCVRHGCQKREDTLGRKCRSVS